MPNISLPHSIVTPVGTASIPRAATRPTTLAPTAPQERVTALDVLRGFAMFGVLWSNLNDWYDPAIPRTTVDRALAIAQVGIVEGRFYTILATLFGLGFALQLIRADARGADGSVAYMRRLAVLLGIGLVHGLVIWRGDILTLYATLGFALLLFRGLSQRGLVIAAAMTFWILPLVRQGVFELVGITPVPGVEWWAASYVYAHGTAAQVFAMRAHDFYDSITRFWMWPVPGILTLFVLGLWLGRSGIIRRLPEHLPTIRKLLGGSIAVALVSLYARNHLPLWWPASQAPTSVLEFLNRVPRDLVVITLADLPTWAMSLSYVCAVILLAHTVDWSRRLAPLAATGRMALTTYLTQSIVCSLLFYNYGLDWFGRVSYAGMLGVALALFALQMLLSVWWLKRYRFGPVEWLWRSLSYGKRQPLRV